MVFINIWTALPFDWVGIVEHLLSQADAVAPPVSWKEFQRSASTHHTTHTTPHTHPTPPYHAAQRKKSGLRVEREDGAERIGY